MSKAISFVKLDFITVKPYMTLKNLAILVIAMAVMASTDGGTASTAGFIMVLGALYVSYPFAVAEKNDLDALYCTLSLSRKQVVRGRYLFALAIDLLFALLAVILSAAVSLVMGVETDILQLLIAVLVMLLIYGLVQAIQLPIFFKMGYTKAKFFSYLPFVGWPAAVMLFAAVADKGDITAWLYSILRWIEANPAITVLLALALWAAAVFVSFGLSLKFYRNRDF